MATEARKDIQDDPPGLEQNQSGMKQEQESEDVETHSAQEQIQVEIPPDPCIEWPFNNFLAQIAREINKDELEILKSLFQGYINRGVLEECDTCTKFFKVLRTRRCLSPVNITYLNKMLDVIQRYDLQEKAAQYCRKEPKTVYYYTSTEDTGTEPGTKCVKFHVVTSIKKINRETIDRLRNNVARIVCAPVELITVESVEPGSSLITVLMLPEIYVNILRNLLKENADLWELSILEVDRIVIDEEVYNITEVDYFTESDQQKEILNVYEQLKQKCEELEKVDFQALHNCQEIDKLRLKLDESQKNLTLKLETAAMLEERNRDLQIVISTFNEKFIISPDGKAAMHGLDLAMQQANRKEQDMDLIERLLLLNTKIVAEYARNINEAQREKEKAIRKEIEFKEMELFHQLTSASKSPEEIIKRKYSLCTSDQNLVLEEMTLDVLKMLNEHLSEDDRKMLIQDYNWTENDVTKACIDKDRGLFLVGILCKETEKAQSQQNLSVFTSKIQQTTQRTDLLQLLREIPDRLLNRAFLQGLEEKTFSPEDLLTAKYPQYIHDGDIYQLDQPVKNVLKKISNVLTEANKNTLLLRYTWVEKDVIKECIDRDSDVFLLGLHSKECEKIGKPVETATFVLDILKEIERPDLISFVERIKPGSILKIPDDKTMESMMESIWKTRTFKTLMQKVQKEQQEQLQSLQSYRELGLD